MPADISSFILVLKVNTKHQASKWSCPVKKMRILYTLIYSTYVIRIVDLISFMVLNIPSPNLKLYIDEIWTQRAKFLHSEELAIPLI